MKREYRCGPPPINRRKKIDMANDPNWRLPDVPPFTLTSPGFSNGEMLPTTVRGDGGNQSPALEWNGAPEGTKSYAVTLYDPDAPTGSGFWHWALYNLPGDTSGLPAGAGTVGPLPDGVVTLANEMGGEEFTGAAPPAGHGEHRYFFTVSALSETLDLPRGATPAVLGFMMRDIIIGRAQLMGVQVTPE